MSTNRMVVFANNEIYHAYNRGVEKRPTFTDRREYRRAIETITFYRYLRPQIRFSHLTRLKLEAKTMFLKNLIIQEKQVELLAFCLMPNHFHFLLRQLYDGGISRFLANFTNSYTKYFNTKHERVGPLFQGVFKATHIDSDEILLHVSRYIHLNPVSSFLIKTEDLRSYQWSSYNEYASEVFSPLCDIQTVLSSFKNRKEYERFVLDQADYAKTLEMMKHVTFDE